jgi:putative flippase GtrA
MVDATLLTTLVHGLDWSHYTARAVSFVAAVTVTWLCNRRFVFQRSRDARKEFGAYFVTQVIGAVINLGTYALLIELVPGLARVPVVPLAGGGILALLFNYSAASRWVFANPRLDGRGGP